MQERCNSIANTLELHLSCTDPSISGRPIVTIPGHPWIRYWLVWVAHRANTEPLYNTIIFLRNTWTPRRHPWRQGVHCCFRVHSMITILSLSCYIDGLVQDCSISIALAMEILQSCTKPSICSTCIILWRGPDALEQIMIYFHLDHSDKSFSSNSNTTVRWEWLVSLKKKNIEWDGWLVWRGSTVQVFSIRNCILEMIPA